jgi:hypothetical protein
VLHCLAPEMRPAMQPATEDTRENPKVYVVEMAIFKVSPLLNRPQCISRAAFWPSSGKYRIRS